MKEVKKVIKKIIDEALHHYAKEQGIRFNGNFEISVERTKDEKLGDYASNIALVLSKDLNEKPIDIAKSLARVMAKQKIISKIETPPPGFINLFLTQEFLVNVLHYILEEDEKFGYFPSRAEKVQIEFVSANPTGPLHVGHGRGAAIGDSLANLLTVYGYKVSKEYYVNDVGGQIETLGMSLKLL